jgi:chorismate--pyruvate lyase
MIWRRLEAWPAAARPAGLWPFISEAGSLTERLRARAAQDFKVRVLQEGPHVLSAEDAAFVGAEAGDSAFMRQVYLCGREPWVYARSLGAVAQGGARWLKRLGEQPLGDRVFAEADTRRGAIEVAQLSAGQPLYEDAVMGLGADPVMPLLWARRSILSVGGARLLIYECFLPGLAGTSKN